MQQGTKAERASSPDGITCIRDGQEPRVLSPEIKVSFGPEMIIDR